jgi:hypothetical protein
LQIIGVLIVVAIFFSILISSISIAPWVPSPKKHLRQILGIANIKPGERFYDLGSGDGRAVICAAKDFGARATGIELSLPLFVSSTIKCFFSRGQSNIILGNLFKRDFSDADVIYIYGTPQAMENRLRAKIEKECKPGTRIVTFVFEFPGWKPVAVELLPRKIFNKDMAIMLYVLDGENSPST